MKKLTQTFPVLLISLLMVSCNAGPAETEEQMLKAANELDTKFLEAMNNGDTEGLLDTYWNSPDMISYSLDGMGIIGFEKAKAEIPKTMEMMKGAKLELTNRNNKVMGEYVLGYGNWTVTLPDEAGTKMEGRYTDLKAKKDGKWVYVMDHASVPLPPPPPME